MLHVQAMKAHGSTGLSEPSLNACAVLKSHELAQLCYSKTCLKRPPKRRPKYMFSRHIVTLCRLKVLQNAPVEHSAISLTCTKLPPVFKTFVLSNFELQLSTGFTVVGYFFFKVSWSEACVYTSWWPYFSYTGGL